MKFADPVSVTVLTPLKLIEGLPYLYLPDSSHGADPL